MRMFLIGMIIALAGCSTIQPVPEYTKPTISWPTPVQDVDIEWKVKEIDGTMYTMLNLNDNAKLRIFLADVYRYQKDLKGMVCYYIDNSDTSCVPISDDSSDDQ